MINTEDFLERALDNIERLTQMSQEILAQFKELQTNSFSERKEYTETVDAFNINRGLEETGWIFSYEPERLTKVTSD